MYPYARAVLYTALCTLWFAHDVRAQSTQESSASLLESSAIPEAEFEPVNEVIPEQWTQRGPEDYVGGELGVIGLVRQTPNSQVIAVDGIGNVLLDANQLQGDMRFGLCAKVDIYQVTSAFGGTDLQLGYWGINSLDAGATVVANEVHTSFFGGTTSNPITTYSYEYSSNLYSGEANLRLLNTRRFRPLVGMRYFKLEDHFDQFDINGNGARNGFFSLTNNDLYGAQFGFEANLFRYRGLDGFTVTKYGAMHNRVEGSAHARVGGAPAVKNYDGSNYCSLVDSQVGLIYRFVDQLHFRAAYQALYCSDIASGVDQSGAIFFLGLPDQVVFDSRFWQGVSLSATVSF